MRGTVWRLRAGMARAAVALALAGVGGAVLCTPTALAGSPAISGATSLRLFGVVRHVKTSQRTLRFQLDQLALWVAPSSGAFQIDLRRPGYGAWTATQVNPATGAVLRTIPASLVSPSRGLTRFLNIRFLTTSGHLAAQRTYDFCPAESARLNDSGPDNQTYPSLCGRGMGFFPFTQGVVWGIDAGWAAQPVLDGFGFFGPPGVPEPVPPCLPPRFRGSGVSLSPGRYTAVASITSAYRQLFAIPAAQASVSVAVRVTPSPPRPRGCGIRVIGRPAAAAHVHAASAAGSAVGATRDATAAAVAAPDPATLPNLVALPAWQIRVRSARRHDLLTFSATIWNAGPAPFTIEGFRRGTSNVMDAYEYFYDQAGNVVGRAPAGTMFYDSSRGHNHWHIRQLAAYSLVASDGHAIVSQKQSFCIAPTNPVDLTVPGASFAPGQFDSLGFGGSVCDLFDPAALWLREQLPAGWGDTYTQMVAGQAFDITHVPNGTYRVQVRVNPLGVLKETTTTDDLATRVIRLSGHPGKRVVTVTPWRGIKS